MLPNILGKCPDPFCQQEAIWHLAWISTVHTVVCMKQKSLNGSLCETSSWKETGCLCETSSWKETGTSAAHILWHWQGKGLLSCKHYITNHKFFCSSRELPRPPPPPPPPPPNPQEQHTAPQWKTRKLYASDHLKKSPPSSAELTAPCTHAPKSSMHSLRKAELALKTAQTQSPLLRPLLSKTASGHMLCWHYNHT